ncbi:MAG: methylenetetrahydrofolate reductase [Hyphomicrobiaceae bacterium]
MTLKNGDFQPLPSICDHISQSHFVVTTEIVPPIAGGPDELLAIAAPFKDRVDGINVTDGPGASVHMSSVAASAILAQNGFNPVLQLTCRDRNRIALQADLLGAAALGVRDVLFLTGDDPGTGDQPEAVPVFDAKSLDLLNWARRMTVEATLPSGRPISSPPRFCCGAADVPIAPPKDWIPEALLRKAEAGAEFIQTQLCYDFSIVETYISALRDHGLTERLQVLIGTGPIASAKSARWMNKNLFGVHVPEELIVRLENADNPKEVGRQHCVTFVNQLRNLPGVRGVHLMAPGNSGSLPRLLDDLAID